MFMVGEIRSLKQKESVEMFCKCFHSRTQKKGGMKMPAFDGTGPVGMGPRTGRGMGFCWPGGVSPFRRGGFFGVGRGGFPRGGGRGRAWGGGRGWGWRSRGYGYPGRGWGRGWMWPYPTYRLA